MNSLQSEELHLLPFPTSVLMQHGHQAKGSFGGNECLDTASL